MLVKVGRQVEPQKSLFDRVECVLPGLIDHSGLFSEVLAILRWFTSPSDF